jgi:hypothetical protein
MMNKEKIIAYRPDFMKIEGVDSVIDCLILSQLYYWAKKKNFKEFYKKDEELAEEVGLSKRTLERHKITLKNIPGISVFTKGCPPKTWYLVAESIPPICVNQYTQCGGIKTANLAEIYIDAENTTENTTEREEAVAYSSFLSPLSRFYQMWEKHFGKAQKQKRIADWFETTPHHGAAINGIANYAQTCRESGKTPKHPYFYLFDSEFSKDQVNKKVTPLVLANPNNHPEHIRQELIDTFGEQYYLSWFEQTKITEEQESVKITAPNSFVKQKIESFFELNKRFGKYIVCECLKGMYLLTSCADALLSDLVCFDEPTAIAGVIITYLITTLNL